MLTEWYQWWKDKHQNVNDAYLWWLDFIFFFMVYKYFQNFYSNYFYKKENLFFKMRIKYVGSLSGPPVSANVGGRGCQRKDHSLGIILKVLGLCQLVVLSGCVLAGQHQLFGRHRHLENKRERPSLEGICVVGHSFNRIQQSITVMQTFRNN